MPFVLNNRHYNSGQKFMKFYNTAYVYLIELTVGLIKLTQMGLQKAMFKSINA